MDKPSQMQTYTQARVQAHAHRPHSTQPTQMHTHTMYNTCRDQHHNSQLNICRTGLQHAYIGYISIYVKQQSSIMSTNVSVHVRIYYTCIRHTVNTYMYMYRDAHFFSRVTHFLLSLLFYMYMYNAYTCSRLFLYTKSAVVTNLSE